MDNNVVKKCNPALVTNLCQKMNTKLCGTNNSLLSQEKPAIFLKPVIIIGADVPHPAPGDKHRPPSPPASAAWTRFLPASTLPFGSRWRT
ncbi:hypothetical protein MRX96_032390 [Rhipicephalus microplus]